MIPSCRCLGGVAKLSIGVDSGLIIIADAEGYDINEKDHEGMIGVATVKPGTYKVRYEIKETWNGKVSGEGTIKITSGKMVVSDPCYIVKDGNGKWMKWVKSLYENGDINGGVHDERHLKKKNIILIDSMGGDGLYEFQIELRKVKTHE